MTLRVFLLAFVIATPFFVGQWLWGAGEAEKGVEAVESGEHVALPEEVRGWYWTVGTATGKRAGELLDEMQGRDLNTVVIDLKMDDGTVVLDDFGDILAKLRDANVYRIARLAVMRDAALAETYPEIALRTVDGQIWKDKIGSVWVDPSSPRVVSTAIELARKAYVAGFDEIQFDYVRFPSDGEIGGIVYPIYDGRVSKVEVMQRFFKQVGGAMRDEGIPVSFDLFGMTFWSIDDYNIGQRLIDVLPYADWVSPMVYPSHYPDGFEGFSNPAEHPYEIVKRSLDHGTNTIAAISTGSTGSVSSRWRPWLQDFDIGAVYTREMIDEEIRAARDAGASGWILWNARNVYE